MRKQIITLTKNQVRVRAHMEPSDLSTDVPTADQMEEFACEVLEQRFPEVDATNWDSIYALRSPSKLHPKSWGAVDFTLTA